MKNFIAYFDFLGFKTFVEKNSIEVQENVLSRIFRDLEFSLSNGKYFQTSNGIINDLSNSEINAINFSDTVVLWSQNDKIESLQKLLIAAHKFNYSAILNLAFPVRGAIVFDEICDAFHDVKNKSYYRINTVFGNGIIQAHNKANCQNWAGTVIDQSVIEKIIEFNQSPLQFLNEYAKIYKVPYKGNNEIYEREFVLSLVKGQLPLNKIAFESFKNDVELGFKSNNKEFDKPEIIDKLNNTLSFLESYFSENIDS